jgi:hypothetical protein
MLPLQLLTRPSAKSNKTGGVDRKQSIWQILFSQGFIFLQVRL